MIKKEEKRDTFILSSGKEFTANLNIIGLGEPESDDEWHISDGSDGTLWSYPWDEELVYNQYDFTKEDLGEIADYMINLWMRFKKEVTQ